ncbi:hypothetical protein Sme01_72860 [Sphaerisporangium melleum]|uniref:Uncharacterized protein n=1 Tax=Sphaerisporangium melleum TaxID=321316 RepID=A0A917VV91_9ACTN|nr:hypothetical protein GCM10007964_69830 [Sphaerisporangium melleum]GII74810.1 hypothetical protein Sme01_72860 [Sphaerisporangium melleum]
MLPGRLRGRPPNCGGVIPLPDPYLPGVETPGGTPGPPVATAQVKLACRSGRALAPQVPGSAGPRPGPVGKPRRGEAGGHKGGTGTPVAQPFL